jgi:hypothetical protein
VARYQGEWSYYKIISYSDRAKYLNNVNKGLFFFWSSYLFEYLIFLQHADTIYSVTERRQYMYLHVNDEIGIYGMTRFSVALKKFSLIWRRNHCRWRAAKCGPMLHVLGAQGLWAGRDLYRATPAVTRDLGFSGLIRRTAPISRLLRHTWGCGGSILTRILTGRHAGLTLYILYVLLSICMKLLDSEIWRFVPPVHVVLVICSTSWFTKCWHPHDIIMNHTLHFFCVLTLPTITCIKAILPTLDVIFHMPDFCSQ